MLLSGSGGLHGIDLSNTLSGDLHYAQYSYGSPPLGHYVFDLETNPGVQVFSTLISPPSYARSGSNLDGRVEFECKGTTGNPITRVMLFRRSPSGASPAYTYTSIDELSGFEYCDSILVSDDGRTAYVYYGDYGGGTFPHFLNIYHSTDGDLYQRVSHVEFDTELNAGYASAWITPDGKRSLAVFRYVTSTSGHNSMIQVFERGKNQSVFQFDYSGEDVSVAALTPDGTKIALVTCAPDLLSSCTTATLRMVDLSLIPTGVRGQFHSSGSGSPRIELTWDSLPGALSYTVFRGTVDDSRAAVNMGTGILGTQWVDHQVVPGQTYYYWVKMRDTLTHYFSGSARVFAGATSPNAPQPCLINGAVLNTDGTCTLKIPVSISGTGKIEVTGANSWAQVQNAASGTNVMLNDVEMDAYSSSSGPSSYSGGRLFLHAKMPVLPSLISIQSASLSIGTALHLEQVPGSASTMNVVASTQANPNALSAADYSRVNLSPAQVYGSLPQSSFPYFTQAAIPFTTVGKSALKSASGNVFQFALVPGFHLNGNNYPASGSNQLNYVSFLLPYSYYFDYPSAAPPTIDITYTV